MRARGHEGGGQGPHPPATTAVAWGGVMWGRSGEGEEREGLRGERETRNF
jgi:hypothetical protein